MRKVYPFASLYDAGMYEVKRPFRSEFVPIRHLKYHVQIWGEPAPHKTPIVMVHGWMDVAASYQFVVDAMQEDHYIIAPDWRGYGKTAVNNVDSFWFADYLADLDFLLDHYAKDKPVYLVGHSMGGNISMMYAGVRPERIRKLVNLEGFGLPATRAEQAPARYAKWMDQLKELRRGELDLRTYDSVEQVAARLIKTNPRLDRDKAQWLAGHWAGQGEDGRWALLGHPAHRVPSANLYRVEELLALYRNIQLPVLAVEATDNSMDVWWAGEYRLPEYHERLKHVPAVEIAVVDNAGHMLHHDQPHAVAGLIERFFA